MASLRGVKLRRKAEECERPLSSKVGMRNYSGAPTYDGNPFLNDRRKWE